jgi:hypothetical protein
MSIGLLVFLSVLILFTPSVIATSKYTPSSELHCGRGLCYETLYGGTRFIQEDSIWKPIEDARSLKDWFLVAYLENDPDFNITVVDFNYTWIDLILDFQGNYTEYEYDVEDNKIKLKLKLNLSGDNYDLEYEVEDNVTQPMMVEIYGNPFGKIRFGGNSTTVQLQDADTENLDDTYSYASDTSNNGASVSLYVGKKSSTSELYHTWIKFNTSSVPTGINMTDAYLGLWFTTSDGGSGDPSHFNISVFELNNFSWTEENCLNGSDCPHGNIGSLLSYYKPTGQFDTGKYHTFDVFSWTNSTFDDGHRNVSFYINATNTTSSSYKMRSKEDATATTRPYLNLTYIYSYSPQWQNNQSSTQSTYDPTTQSSEFNVTWNTTDSSIANISLVYLETNLSGSATNYTMSNATHGNDTFNYTYAAISGAGDYYWKSYAKNTDNVWNVTDTWTFSVGKYTTNNCHINITVGGSTVTDSDVSHYTSDNVTLTAYCDVGTANLFVAGYPYTNPDSRTWGEGSRIVNVNTAGNVNYSANSSGVSISMNIDSAVSGSPGGGGGGGDTQALQVPGTPSGQFTLYTTAWGDRIEQFGTPGVEMPEITVFVTNGNMTQTFGAYFSEDIVRYCRMTEYPSGAAPPESQVFFKFVCTASEDVIYGNFIVSTVSGAEGSVPLVIGPSIGFMQQFGDFIRLFVTGEWSGFLISYHGWPVAIIVTFIIIFFVLLIRFYNS